jgi:glyceraldehyde 3-phosphate dehydrogenase
VSKTLDGQERTKRSYPLRPKDVVLYGFGRIGRLITRILITDTGAGSNWRLRAVIIRDSGHNDDLIKRASLLRNDSVHGTFPGTIRVNKKNNSFNCKWK